jgi:hypothetical protein
MQNLDFPFSYITKDEFEKLSMSVTRPNELRAVVEYYYNKERDYVQDKYEGFRKRWFESKETKELRKKIEKVMIYDACREYYEYDLSIKELIGFGNNKSYEYFFCLTDEEVDDMVKHYKAYQATIAVRKIRDFYNAEKKDNIVCFVNHEQRREFNWLLKNQMMVKEMLRDYEKSEAYNNFKN